MAVRIKLKIKSKTTSRELRVNALVLGDHYEDLYMAGRNLDLAIDLV